MKKRINDQTLALLIRMWVAGMVCLFVAWTPLGGGDTSEDSFLIQMIFMLALFLFIANLLIVDPVVRGMFKTKFDRQGYYQQPVWIRSARHVLQFTKMIAITMLIWLAYIFINFLLGLADIVDPSGKPVIMLEPITFGILYGLFYFLFDKLESLWRKLIVRKEKNC